MHRVHLAAIVIRFFGPLLMVFAGCAGSGAWLAYHAARSGNIFVLVVGAVAFSAGIYLLVRQWRRAWRSVAPRQPFELK